MKLIPLLCILLIALPAAADENWAFDVSGAALVWEEGRRLSPVEAGVLRDDAEPPHAPGAPRIRVQALARNAWRVMRQDEASGGELWARQIHVDAVPRGIGGTPSYFSAIAWHPRPTRAGSASSDQIGRDVVLGLGRGALIVAIDAPTGLVRWQVAQVWEYVRSQEDPPNYDMRMLRVRGRGERSRLLEEACVAAGPVVVAHGDSYRVFAGVTEERERETATPIPESRVYEIDEWGQVIAVVQLPRALVTDGGVATDGGVLFAMRGGALARIEPSFQQEGGWRGEGGTDREGRLAWYVEPPPEPPGSSTGWRPPVGPDAWLRTQGMPDAVAVCGPYVVQPRAGAQADKSENGAWTFPLRRLDVRTRQFRNLDLQVPFRGTVPPPAVNYAGGTAPDGVSQYDAFTRHEAWLEAIHVIGGHLALDVRRGRGAVYRWTFALPDVPKAESGTEASRHLSSDVLRTEDPPVGQESPTLEEALRPDWPEVRMMDPDSLIAPLAVPDRGSIERLTVIALAGPSPVQRAAARALSELPQEAADLVPRESLAEVVQLLSRCGLSIYTRLLERLVQEAPDAALVALATIRLESHSSNAWADATHPLRQLGAEARDLMFRSWTDQARNINDRLSWGSHFSDDETPIEVRQAKWSRLRDLLRDADPKLRAAAATELSGYESPAAREGTLEMTKLLLRSAYIEVRLAGAVLAGSHVSDGPEEALALAAGLGEALETPDERVVRQSLAALENLGTRARSEAAAIRSVLRGGPAGNRAQALWVLGAVSAPDDEETIRVLEEYGAGPDVDLAEDAKGALERLRRR